MQTTGLRLKFENSRWEEHGGLIFTSESTLAQFIKDYSRMDVIIGDLCIPHAVVARSHAVHIENLLRTIRHGDIVVATRKR